VPSQTEVENLQSLLSRLGVLGAAALTQVWDRNDIATLKLLYPDLIGPLLAAAGTLTAEWYFGLNPSQPFAAIPAPIPQAEVLSKSVGWAFTQTDPLQAAVGSTERHIFTLSRETVVSNAQREGVRWARYASANACPWCRVLATREAVYRSAENAIKGHDNCNCMAVPIRDGDQWTPPDYVQGWLEEYNTARAQAGGNLDDIVNQMRLNASR
jgi:hypothetical protein